MPELKKDYRGLLLCEPCWNNQHNHKEWGTKRKVIVDCLQNGCQCPCVELLHEKHPKVKPDYSAQTSFNCDYIQIGEVKNDQHRDEN